MSGYLPVGESYKLIDSSFKHRKKTIENMSNTNQLTDILGDLKLSGSLTAGSITANDFLRPDGRSISTQLPSQFIPIRRPDYTILQLTNNNLAGGSGNLWLNDDSRVLDGGPSTMTMRNDAGSLRLLSKGDIGFTVTETNTTLNNNLNVTGSITADNFIRTDGSSINTGTQLPSQIVPARRADHTVLQLSNNKGDVGKVFINDDNRSTDGGSATMTVRNDAGDLRLLSRGDVGLTITETNTTINNSLSVSGDLSIGGVTIPRDKLTKLASFAKLLN